MAPTPDPNSVGGGAKQDEASVKVPSKDPKKKDEKKEDDLSEEDLELKQNLELYVERVQDPNPELQRAALESMRQEIRASTSSMTSVPKPLKFLRPHYGTLKAFHETMADSDLRKYLSDILSVLALTMSAEGERESLSYRLIGTEGDIGSWGHEYVRNLAGEIAQEYSKRQSEEAPIDDLMELVQQIVAFHMKHNAETEAVDLLMDVEDLDLLLEHVDKTNFKRTCNYLTSAAKYLPGPDDMLVLDISYMIYMKFEEYPNALQIALFLDNTQYVKQVFTSCADLLRKKQFCYMIARHGITFDLDDEMVADDDDREALQDIVNNTKLSEGYLTLARDIEVMEAKTPEDIYKAHLLDGRSSSGASVDSARQNLAVVKMEREQSLPYDITRRIMKMLPLKSAARLCTVSTTCLSVISQLKFAESHDTPHFLFTNTGVTSSKRYRWFQWATEEEVFSEDELMKVNEGDGRYSKLVSEASLSICQPIGGLLLCYSLNQLLLCNPSGKFFNLPTCPISGEIAFFLGFDPIGERFMVLAVFDAADAQVLKLVEGGELVWTAVPSNIPYSPEFVLHGPDKIGMYFEGKIHFFATHKNKGEQVLMEFDIHKETFSFIPLPVIAWLGHQRDYKLIKFQGKLALVIDPILSGGEVHMVVLDDYQTQKWSKHSFILRGWGSLVPDHLDEQYHCMGTVSTGELIFAPEAFVPPGGAVVLLSYNMKDKVLSGFKMQGVASEDDDSDELMTFVGYIVEPILLPGGSVEFYRRFVGSE